MHRNDLVRGFLSSGGAALDRTGRQWPGDLVVVTDEEDHSVVVRVVEVSGPVDAEAVHAELRPGTAPASGAVPTVVLLPVVATQLPVAAVVDAVVSAGTQVVASLALEDPDTPTALIVRAVGADGPVLHPYLKWQDEPVPVSTDAVLRLVSEHVVEGYVWRAVETQARDAERLRAAAEQARSEAVDQLAAVRTERDETVAAALDDAEAARLASSEVEVRRAALERRVQRITSSRSYRLARRLAAVRHGAARLVGVERRDHRS